MNARKQREKNRRRAHKLADQAWESADDGNLYLAVKQIRRANELNPGNPLLWNDLGMLLLQLGDEEQAATAFQATIHLASDFAEAYASLAAIRARQGNLEQAAILQRQAVRHAPDSERQRGILASYEALLAAGFNLREHANRKPLLGKSEIPAESAAVDQFGDLKTRIKGLDWDGFEMELTRSGISHLPHLLTAAESESLRAMFDDDRLFAKTVSMNKSRFGKGVYRYFGSPLPELVDAIRQQIYPHAAQIANRWQHLLGSEATYPSAWSEFQGQCARAGQSTPSPLLLRYEAGGFNSPHQDIRGDVYFPLQLVIVLNRRVACGAVDPDAFSGGEFLFCDQPERKPSDRRAIPAGLGDAILFCTRARLVRVGDIYGLKSARHGLAHVTAGTRYAIGIPFHEFV